MAGWEREGGPKKKRAPQGRAPMRGGAPLAVGVALLAPASWEASPPPKPSWMGFEGPRLVLGAASRGVSAKRAPLLPLREKERGRKEDEKDKGKKEDGGGCQGGRRGRGQDDDDFLNDVSAGHWAPY